jgi:F-type H+-transporting ATPase subunit b
MHRQAEADAQKRRAEEAKANEQRAAALAVDIAGRLLDRLPPAVRVMGFLDGLVDALRALPAIQRKALADPAAGLRLAAARTLSADELSGCTQAIQAALGCRSAISPEVEPGLIAGLELRSNDLLVGNHLRADLDQLRRELSDADGTA